jgi:hypothetical protein
MSEEEHKHHDDSSDSSIYYILGGVVLVAAIAGFFLLKPKEKTMEATTPQAVVQEAPAVSPTVAPITKLACDKQYYNPMIGLTKYYLSVEGTDTLTTGDIKCEYSFLVKDKVVGNATATASLVADPARGGGTFRCQTNPAVELARGVQTKVTVKVTNPNQETAECSQNFIFP